MSTLASRQRHGHDSVSPGLGLPGSEEGVQPPHCTVVCLQTVT